MTVRFPNPVRRYEPARGCISFWGYDSSMEVVFQLDLNMLQLLGPELIDGSEGAYLVTFDLNRSIIFQVARAAYQKNRRRYHRLSSIDFAGGSLSE